MNQCSVGPPHLRADLSGWDVSNVTRMDDMFLNASAFNGNISGWNTISLTTMEEMFMNANSFTGGDLTAGIRAM